VRGVGDAAYVRNSRDDYAERYTRVGQRTHHSVGHRTAGNIRIGETTAASNWHFDGGEIEVTVSD